MKIALAPSFSLRITACLITVSSITWLSTLVVLGAVNALQFALSPITILWMLSGTAALSTLALILVSCRWLYPVSRRIDHISLSLEQLERGTFTAPLETTARDEFGRIVNAINRIAENARLEDSQRERDQQNLSHQATHDELTGLSNRKFGNETIARLSNTDEELTISILFLDLDGFKAINDTCGHAIGDEILVAVSLRLKAALSDDTVLIRWGGDEFVIVLPGCDQRAAISVAQDVADLFKLPMATTDGIHKLGCSIGLSTSRPNTSLDTVLQEADANMYDNKRRRKSATPIVNEVSANDPFIDLDNNQSLSATG